MKNLREKINALVNTTTTLLELDNYLESIGFCSVYDTITSERVIENSYVNYWSEEYGEISIEFSLCEINEKTLETTILIECYEWM